MIRKFFAISLCLIAVTAPAVCVGDASEVADSSYWSKLVHEENSLVASVLYLPYMFLQIPGRIIEGIVNPKPASQATIPPAAHRAH
ncbi:MAG: hypothetical protein ACLP5H_12280 [Desulfomonilaceae bacterium]